MVEGARLESVYGVTPIPGSNPGLSAINAPGAAARAAGGRFPRGGMGRALRKKAL